MAGADGEDACLPGTPRLAAAGKGRCWGTGALPGKRKAIFCSHRPGSPRRGGWSGVWAGGREKRAGFPPRRFLARVVPDGQAASWACGPALPGRAPIGTGCGGEEGEGCTTGRRAPPAPQLPARSEAVTAQGKGRWWPQWVRAPRKHSGSVRATALSANTSGPTPCRPPRRAPRSGGAETRSA